MKVSGMYVTIKRTMIIANMIGPNLGVTFLMLSPERLQDTKRVAPINEDDQG